VWVRRFACGGSGWVFGEVEGLDFGEGGVGGVPGAEELPDGVGGEAGGDEAADGAGGLFLAGGWLEAFSVAELAGEGELVGVGVGGFESVGDEVLGEAFLGEVLLDAATAEGLVFLPEAGVVGGEAGVGEVFEVDEASDDAVDVVLALIAGEGAWLHEAAEVALGAGAAGEGADGVLEEAVLADGVAFFGAGEGHGSSAPGWGRRRRRRCWRGSSGRTSR